MSDRGPDPTTRYWLWVALLVILVMGVALYLIQSGDKDEVRLAGQTFEPANESGQGAGE